MAFGWDRSWMSIERAEACGLRIGVDDEVRLARPGSCRQLDEEHAPDWIVGRAEAEHLVLSPGLRPGDP